MVGSDASLSGADVSGIDTGAADLVSTVGTGGGADASNDSSGHAGTIVVDSGLGRGSDAGGNTGDSGGSIAAGGAGGQNTTNGGQAGDSGLVRDAGLSPLDAATGGMATGGTGGTGGSTSGGTGATGGSRAGATGGVGGRATGGSPSADAGLDAVFRPDAGGDAVKTEGGDARSWRLLWSDEFDREADAGVDRDKWNVVTWDPGTVNNELQKYTNRTQNLFHDGLGHLVLRGLNDFWRSGNTTYPYTSARIQTDGKFEFKFGRVEIRAKLPAGKGSFPGMVLMGTSGSWPQCGEIALMEQWGQDKTSLYCSTYSGWSDELNQKVTFPASTSLTSEFHTYAIEWYTDHIVFFIDDAEVARTATYDSSSPFARSNNDFYLILDVAIGGNMGGAVDDDNGFPMDMVLDYVRVYSP